MVVRSKACKEGGRALNSVWNSLLISEVVIHEGSIILFGGTPVPISRNCCIGHLSNATVVWNWHSHMPYSCKDGDERSQLQWYQIPPNSWKDIPGSSLDPNFSARCTLFLQNLSSANQMSRQSCNLLRLLSRCTIGRLSRVGSKGTNLLETIGNKMRPRVLMQNWHTRES